MDIGADESDGTAWTAGPYVIMRVSPEGNDGHDGSSWALAKRTVQAGIDAASALGGEVWVQAGTYYERITLHPYAYVYGGFAGVETARDERDWDTNVTTLDGQQQGSVVTVRTGYGTVGAIDGFTITNGRASSGGGLYLDSSSPTITNNTITANGAGDYGGGLYLSSTSPTISNNTIKGNSAGKYGGGLHLSSSSPTIADNTITGNVAGNYGGGLYLSGSSPTIANNTITGNIASWGGGLYLSGASPTIVNNTVTGNGAYEGGGLYLDWSSPTIANTIVAFNSSGVSVNGGTPTLRYNCVYGNSAYDYSGLTDPTGTDGNISADPRLADPTYGNMHIQLGSPCVDAGNNADAYGEFDMDGQPRIQPVGGTVDIGADESDGTVWPAGPYVIVRVALEGDDDHDGSSWSLAMRTVQAGIDAASALGGEVWVQSGTYYERITLRRYAYVYGGFSGSETERDERDWSTNATILDGQQQGSVVTVQAGYRVSVIDGFTITNGRASYGGGLYLFGGSPTIANNTITGNSAVSGNGGGLYLGSSSPTIANNTITGNSAYDGGGLYLDYGSSPTVANNTITDNIALNGCGGGLYLWSSSPTIANNTITGNIAFNGYGGGLCLGASSPTIVNNTIAGNSGGGLYLYYYSFPRLANTIVAFNSSGIYRSGTGGTPALRYNCVYGNTAYDYSGLTDPTGTNDNISADPMLVRNPSDGGDGGGDNPATPDVDEGANDDYGDVRLRAGSPAINAGDPGFVAQPGETDLDGHARVLCGRVDMGAYEFGIGDYDCDQSVDMADFALWAGCMGGPSGAELRMANGEERMTQAFDMLNGASHEIGSQQFEIGNSCVAFDFDADGDTDLHDFAGFQRVFVGP